ncbi:hypothetical protein LB572_29355 [Mesorhizobium sp. BH1-1-5]|uniref:hypothetical protein n=1 Tax=unclassified Mesorhizobium TaxID=325217 RepID=UPI001125C740|nr:MULTISPECIES: hypothetical protein [unclassified Mesorhizobium]MBZ9991204.1 hypothetical protein [Mesorhizobium sp. BH1-1-5]TPJ74647.1 hypothetical protein FJ471_01450 [Mesorhizobium sp. B2-7-1]
MKMTLNLEGASPEEVARGISAAEAVFAEAGITAEEAADGMFALEGWDGQSFSEDAEPTEDDDAAAAVWMKANKAALEACCAGWPEVPRELRLELLE